MKKLYLFIIASVLMACSKDTHDENTLKTLTPKIEVKKGTEVLGDISKDGKIVLDHSNQYTISIVFDEEVQLIKGDFFKVKEVTAKEYFADFYGRNRAIIAEKVVFQKEGYQDYVLEITQNELIERFALAQSEVALDEDETLDVEVISGNLEYVITQDANSKAVALVEYTNQKFTITPQSNSSGKTTRVSIRDVKSGDIQTLAIEIYPAPSIPKDAYTLANEKTVLTKWIDDTLTNIDMESDRILKNVKIIGGYSFRDATMSSLILPQGLTSIGEVAFYNCENLISLTIPSGVTSIGRYAFYVSPLETIRIENPTPPRISPTTFVGTNDLQTIYVPQASVDAYKSAPYWSSVSSKIQGY